MVSPIAKTTCQDKSPLLSAWGTCGGYPSIEFRCSLDSSIFADVAPVEFGREFIGSRLCCRSLEKLVGLHSYHLASWKSSIDSRVGHQFNNLLFGASDNKNHGKQSLILPQIHGSPPHSGACGVPGQTDNLSRFGGRQEDRGSYGILLGTQLSPFQSGDGRCLSQATITIT